MGRNILVLAFVACGLCQAAFGAVDVATVYNGQAKLPATISVGVWGANGKDNAAVTPVTVKSAGAGIPVSTRGRYQGTRIDLTTPIDTASFLGKEDAFLELYLRAVDTKDKAADKIPAPMPDLNDLRFTFVTVGGTGTLDVAASDFFPCDEAKGAWVRIAIPLLKLDPKQKMSGTMSRMIISSDAPAEFLLGRLAFVREVSPLRVNVSTYPGNLVVGKSITFSAGADGGLTPCEVLWDFDTASGVTVDATGNRVTYTYDNPGSYTVTCTVRDVNGIRDPVTVTKVVKVARP